MAVHEVVVCIQDTTELDFNSLPTGVAGLIKLNG